MFCQRVVRAAPYNTLFQDIYRHIAYIVSLSHPAHPIKSVCAWTHSCGAFWVLLRCVRKTVTRMRLFYMYTDAMWVCAWNFRLWCAPAVCLFVCFLCRFKDIARSYCRKPYTYIYLHIVYSIYGYIFERKHTHTHKMRAALPHTALVYIILRRQSKWWISNNFVCVLWAHIRGM